MPTATGCSPAPRRLRRILACGALGLVLLGLGCGEPIEPNWLQFWQHQKPQGLLEQRFPGLGGRAWSEEELSPALSSQELRDSPTRGPAVDVNYTSPSDRTEAHLYARDPVELKETLALEASLLLLQLVPGTWDAETNIPTALPVSLVVPANVHPSDNKLTLESSDFFVGTTPVGPAGAPGTGSVKAIRVYDHGACSREEDMLETLDLIGDQLWEGFVFKGLTDQNADTPICSNDATGYRLLSRAIPYLDHNAGDFGDMRGGFFLNFDYYIAINSLLVPDNTIKYVSWHEFQLQSGIIGLSTQGLHRTVTGCDVAEACDPQNIADQLDEALVTTLPTQFAEQATKRQTRPVLGTGEGFTGCNPEAVSPCGAVFFKVDRAVNDGANVLEQLGEPAYSGVERGAMTTALTGSFADWTCVADDPANPPADPNPLGNHCELIVRAKRLNVYPDKLELVWFDGREVNNQAYALWVMAHNPTDPTTKPPTFDQGAVDQLCGFTPHSEKYARAYAKSNLPFASSHSLCELWAVGGGGVASSAARWALDHPPATAGTLREQFSPSLCWMGGAAGGARRKEVRYAACTVDRRPRPSGRVPRGGHRAVGRRQLGGWRFDHCIFIHIHRGGGWRRVRGCRLD